MSARKHRSQLAADLPVSACWTYPDAGFCPTARVVRRQGESSSCTSTATDQVRGSISSRDIQRTTNWARTTTTSNGDNVGPTNPYTLIVGKRAYPYVAAGIIGRCCSRKLVTKPHTTVVINVQSNGINPRVSACPRGDPRSNPRNTTSVIIGIALRLSSKSRSVSPDTAVIILAATGSLCAS